MFKKNFSSCVNNAAYGSFGNIWGLTASDDPKGYAASPTNDDRTLPLSAAISTMFYAPQKPLRTMRYFYEYLKDKIWRLYGFNDAFKKKRVCHIGPGHIRRADYGHD